jgi:uridylate kinase
VNSDNIDPANRAEIQTAVGMMRTVLNGMYVQDQLAVLAQVTGYLLATVREKAGKNTYDVARTTYATMLRNVTSQWLAEYRGSKGVVRES